MDVILILALYFTPLIIAAARKLPNTGSVAVINILLGWTLVGWIVALAMAAGSGQPRGTQVNVINQPTYPSPAVPPVPQVQPADDPEIVELRKQLAAAELRNKITETDRRFYEKDTA
jgi:hypothetical protein